MTAVSPAATATWSGGTPNCSAQICASAVLIPFAHRHGAGVDGDAARAADPHDARFERAAAGPLHAIADTDAEVAAVGARAALALGEAGIVDGFEGDALVGRKVAAVECDRRAGAGLQRRDIGHLLRRHQIAAADFGAVESELVGDAVEQALHGKGALGIAGAAHRHGGDLVGLDHAYVNLKGRQHVGTGQRRRRVVGKVDALRRVGAFVVDHVSAHAEQVAVFVEGDLEIPILVAFLHGGEEMLAPILDPLDRPPQQETGRGERHLLRIHDELGAEAAADVGRHDPELVFVEPE